MEEIFKLLTDNGISVVCVGFLIYYINTTMKDNNKILVDIRETLVSITSTLSYLNNRVDSIEDKIHRKEK